LRRGKTTKDKSWSGLDNAALIFPAAVGGSDTQVFRISCELYEPVDPAVLQTALEQTAEAFPLYRSVLKRGLFWYYLESTDRMPSVHEEDKRPCAVIYRRSGKNLLFDVSWFRNRVNLEVYHVLSDGTGALYFLRTLMVKYLSLVHRLPEPAIDYDASAMQMSDDSFQKYYTGSHRIKGIGYATACHLSGRRYPENGMRIITGLTDIRPVLEAAHSRHATLTAYLCACLMEAVSETVSVRMKKRPIVLSVPVNLRGHFPSASARNFFSVLLVGYDYGKRDGSFENVLKKVGTDLKGGLVRENLSRGIDAYSAVEHNVFARAVPLYLKDLALKAAYHYAMRRETAGVSNIGIVSMPQELTPYIRSFDMCSGTNNLQVCVCSFQNRLSISFSSPFVSAEIQRRFFRTLADLGAEIEITASPVDDEGDGGKR
jgi:hypothetical protein